MSLKAIARTLDEVAGQPYWDTPWFSGTPGMRERVRDWIEQIAAGQPNLKVPYTTGYTRNAVVHNGVLDTGTHLLPKPFGIAQLAEKVRMALDR